MKHEMICHCGDTYWAREADLKRGWARSCSKHCAAVRRDFGRPAGKRKDGVPIKTKKKGARRLTPDTRTYKTTRRYEEMSEREYDEHPFSCEGLGQWLD